MDDEAPTLLPSDLPAIIDGVDVHLTDLIPVTANSDLNALKEADVAVANDMLRLCYAGFTKATSISSLCKLMAQSLSTIEHRRKILCVPYGAEVKSSKNQFLEPLD